MKKEFTAALYIAAVGVVIFVSWIFRMYVIPIPAPLPFGMILLTVLLFSNLLYELFRGISPQVIFNGGHYSINTTKDLHKIPFYTDLMGKEEIKNKTLGDFMIMFPGGVEAWGLSVKSTSDYPCFIFPAKYCEKEGDSYHIHANLMKYKYSELPRYIRYALQSFGRRVNPKSTSFYYAVTSHIDGTATPKNLEIVLKAREDDEHSTQLEDKLKSLYKELRRDSEKKSRTFLVKQSGDVDEK